MNYRERFTKLFEELGVKSAVYKNTLWGIYNGMVQPIGPVMFDYSVSFEEAKYILNQVGGILIRWTDGFEGNKTTEWYAVVCDKFIDMSELPSKNRCEIRRGLKNCKVEMVNAEYIAKKGYEVYVSAFNRYKRVRKPKVTELEFSFNIIKTRYFDDIIHHWGIFYEDKLIGYSTNYIFDNVEVNYYTVYFHPSYLKLYSSCALFYTMNKYYLQEKNFKYVNDGFRSILHETEIQDFLQKKFFFKEAYTNLHIVYKPYVGITLKALKPFRFFLEKIELKIEALYIQDSISRKCTKKSLGTLLTGVYPKIFSKRFKEDREVEQIAALHQRYLNKGFLSSLGMPFLKLMYQLMNNSHNAFYLIEEEDEKIVGFISGAISVRGFYKEFFKKNILREAVNLLPKLINPVTLRKTLETLFYPLKKENDLPDAELLSIVVEEHYQGKGVGRKLFMKLVNEFKKLGVFRFKVVVGSNLIDACRFYEKMGGVFFSETEVHKGEKSRIYKWDLMNERS